MRIDLGPGLEALRAEALAAVDARAAAALRALRDPAFAGLDAARVTEARAVLAAPAEERTVERFPTLALRPDGGDLADRAQTVLAAEDSLARQQRAIEAGRLAEKARIRAARTVRELRGAVAEDRGR